MTVISVPLGFAGMARKEAPKTDQVNFRFPVDLIEELEAYREKHPLHPTVTNILIDAARRWLAENPLPKPSPSPRR